MISVGNSARLDAATRAWCQCLGQAEQPWAPQQPLALAHCGAVCISGALTPPLLHATMGISEARRATCPELGFPVVGYWVLFCLNGVRVCAACFSRDTFSVGGEAEMQCACTNGVCSEPASDAKSKPCSCIATGSVLHATQDTLTSTLGICTD